MWTIIVSPVSGKRRGADFAENSLIPELKAQGIPFELVTTKYFQHAKEIAKGKSKVIVLGGDGTINEVLESVSPKASVAILSQGTMNFFSVCSDLPTTAKEVVDLIATNSLRASSLISVTTNTSQSHISFEALHIGKMAFNVCQGASEWRSTLGPMFGIALNLVVGCAIPACQRGTLKIWQQNGSYFQVEDTEFYWIIATYRNPYNGVVGNDLWISWMTQEFFPGFGRMMKFFEPQMEHYQGTSRCFPFHYHANPFFFEFTGREYEQVALVLDGDAKPNSGRKVVGVHSPRSWNLVASPIFPKEVNTNKINVGGGKNVTPKPLTPGAKAWLTMHPRPRGVFFPPPDMGGKTLEENPDDEPKSKWTRWVVVLLVGILVSGIMRKRLALPS